MSKYGAKKIEVDGIVFASGAEHRRYEELKLLYQAGEIEDLTIHEPRYELAVNGTKITHYTPDFTYYDIAADARVVEDVKGGRATKTRDYVMRRKLMKAIHGIEIKEIAA